MMAAMLPEARDNEEFGVDDFVGPVAATFAVGIFLWQATRTGGWLEAAFGGLAVFFWMAVALWLITSIIAVRARRHWWVIATAPFALYPIIAVVLLASECAQGNCL